ncbi:uncharacterized protein BYT42DRAFT_157119 [Radiomyces spectabilis]|uniref:uncharacterized protein n=1 Tax=Radiomyces spectabilis TaxID=64574 RepID=UPI00221ED9A9|nr:uncharacterized protein BYT42DRAFT_157119 [Radiomyces spectabilis]KAI8365228.1 hypothetical protein BYT42DRAFT_157119 [Radiomyces spectabilis]
MPRHETRFPVRPAIAMCTFSHNGQGERGNVFCGHCNQGKKNSPKSLQLRLYTGQDALDAYTTRGVFDLNQKDNKPIASFMHTSLGKSQGTDIICWLQPRHCLCFYPRSGVQATTPACLLSETAVDVPWHSSFVSFNALFHFLFPLPTRRL